MEIKIINQPISLSEADDIAQKNYGEMAKGVVDLNRKIIALGGELHADAESLLLENGSKQEDLWGFNIYPQKPREDRLKYTSFINIRPSQNNTAIEIQDENLKNEIKNVIESLIEDNSE